MINGNGSLSLRKKDLNNQKIPAVGFVKTVFAHKATAGATQINLTSLTVPTEMTSNGFSNPSVAQLTAAQLLFYKKNLTLVSSLRGTLQQDLSYKVSSSTVITFIDFTAEEGEIFVGTIDYTAVTGNKVVDAAVINATGTLAANATDFNVGMPFTVGKYAGNSQIGDVMVFLDGVIQYRNSGNSSTVLDGNYYEVDAGNGLGTLIRFNIVDPINVRDVVVVGTGIVSERPDGSMMAVIENLAGQIDSMAEVVSDLSGLPETTVTGGAPNNVDLKAFGDRVLAIEGNRARVDQTNTFTAYQNIPGRTDGASTTSGYIGERLTWATPPVDQVVTTTETDWTNANIVLTPGRWLLVAEIVATVQTGSGTSVDVSNIVTITDTANVKLADMARVLRASWSSATAGSVGNYGVLTMSHVVNTNTNTTYKIRLQRNDGGAAGTANALNTGPTLKSNFYAIRIA
jgi:hypothetical protein